MARTLKQSALEAFKINIADAVLLIQYTKALSNTRKRKMREELRSRVGEAFRIPQKHQSKLDIIENDAAYVVFKDHASLGRSNFDDLRPLLRQSILAACAAFETFLSDRINEAIPTLSVIKDYPKRLREVPMSLGHWIDINTKYKRSGWGLRDILYQHIQEFSSTAPNKVGILLSMAGVDGWASKVDQERNKAKKTTVSELEKITERRNRIAHSADKSGQGRATIETCEAENYVASINEIALAIDKVLTANKFFKGKKK